MQIQQLFFRPIRIGEVACKRRVTGATLSAIAKASGYGQSRIEVAGKRRITGSALSAIAKASGFG
jgi:hypothetical protein